MDNQEKSNSSPAGKPGPKPGGSRFRMIWIYLILLGLFMGINFFVGSGSPAEIDWRKFQTEMLQAGEVDRLIVVNEEFVEVFIKTDALSKDKYKAVRENILGQTNLGPHYKFTIGSVDYFQKQLDEAQGDIAEEERLSPRFETRENWLMNILYWMFPIFILVAIWLFIFRRFTGGMLGGGGAAGGGNPFNSVGKSKAKLFNQSDEIKVSFKDVAGLDEAKEEVMEVVDFLKNPERYRALGARIPRGVLLTGPPGTGKTLMAKAMAGEAKVPFFSLSGSDFVEMFVGVGAARVRDLFKQGKEKAPCIIFIDEIEAIGRSRSRSQSQTNDERENTLNQLLVEMDGFSSDETVIILAATNRPDLLDPALTRPGRFDRQINIDKPDLNGREEIFKVHLRKITLGKDVDARKLAEQTPGFAGAEIANTCNEAALHAARKMKKIVEMEDFVSAIDRVIGGLEKKNKLISVEEKKVIAYHETGHALCGWMLEHAHPLVKVSIIPRGVAALGFAQYLPKEQNIYTRAELLDTICMTLGGRAAEEIVFGDISTGAQNDLERTTSMVYAMITLYGMNKKIGPFSFKELTNEFNLRSPYSDETARLIDIEALQLINECYQRSIELLKKHRKEMDEIAAELREKEVLYHTDFERILGPPKSQKKAVSSDV
jgi:cell division protease FtsH